MGERIIDVIHKKGITLSFEVFPPKKSQDRDLSIIFGTIEKLVDLKPDFISVTYGAGGGNKSRASEISQFIQTTTNSIALAHLTCVGYLKKDIKEILDKFYSIGVRNILALRGDIPAGVTFPHDAWQDFQYAKDLIQLIKEDGRFCIGAAAYPEGHVQCKDLKKTIKHMKAKIEAGADFFITQLFFENELFYKFMDMVESAGITAPVIPGIMPVLRAKQIKRIVELTGASIPVKLNRLLEKYENKPEEMEKAGIEYALAQVEDLIETGVKGIHLYTMNKARQACEIVKKAGLR
ncbi:methylenetetrahydrofolate reductase [NAD(P)H] [Anoxybacter fermentans]|uniref:Methylenetetrahydrofolate reductase n=1 Tax=Anoxybacter fermentans TaxID=1323375 RepID=A0A3S9SWP1_9FIRM|nr:methylenetetrahydrofolate reductase [NAD(P)H] [Anoxybacter fermentans]AZR72688.1 methylenetetrahydrofolate reductase [NAD(P)H] [Anoxybacter fermentans]